MKKSTTTTTTNETTKHTPGPWVVDYSGPARIAIADTFGNEVALCSMQCEDGDTDEANARLIAAAPELLAALQQSIACIEACKDDVSADCWDSIEQDLEQYRAAIAKATA